MPATVEAKIYDAISRHLSRLPAAPPIALPNRPFTKPQGRWLRLRVQPNQTEQAALGDAGWNRHMGVIQIDVMEQENAGVLASSELAGAIVAHFKRGTMIDYGGVIVRVEQPPYASGQITDDGWSMTPVTVRYFCDAPNP